MEKSVEPERSGEKAGEDDMGKFKRRINCYFNPELVDRLDRTAMLLHITRTDLVEAACEKYLRSMHPKP